MSLAGLLVIVVVLGALAAAAIVGVNSMTGSDNTTPGLPTTSAPGGGGGAGAGAGVGGVLAAAARSACNATAGNATTASSAYFAANAGKYPTRWSDMTAATPPIYALPAQVTVNPAKPLELDGTGWRLTMSGGGASAPAFACTYPTR
jgi:hypothetical protein